MELDNGALLPGLDVVEYFKAPGTTDVLEKRALRYVTGRVLDVGCGPGRHSLALAAQGIDVMGIDPSPGCVRVARERGVNALLGSIEAPPAGIGLFDSLLLGGHGFGFLGAEAKAGRVLADLAALTRPGGALAGTFQSTAIGEFSPVLTDYMKTAAARGGLPGEQRLRLVDTDGAGPWEDWLIMTAEEFAVVVAESPEWELRELETQDHYSYLGVLRRL